jgi:hypothetical protein
MDYVPDTPPSRPRPPAAGVDVAALLQRMAAAEQALQVIPELRQRLAAAESRLQALEARGAAAVPRPPPQPQLQPASSAGGGSSSAGTGPTAGQICRTEGCSGTIKRGFVTRYCFRCNKKRKRDWPKCTKCNTKKVDPSKGYDTCFDCNQKDD